LTVLEGREGGRRRTTGKQKVDVRISSRREIHLVTKEDLRQGRAAQGSIKPQQLKMSREEREGDRSGGAMWRTATANSLQRQIIPKEGGYDGRGNKLRYSVLEGPKRWKQRTNWGLQLAVRRLVQAKRGANLARKNKR